MTLGKLHNLSIVSALIKGKNKATYLRESGQDTGYAWWTHVLFYFYSYLSLMVLVEGKTPLSKVHTNLGETAPYQTLPGLH